MIKISIDLTEATKAEYDAYMASGLRKYIVTSGLALDFSGCDVLVEGSSCPHSVERVDSLDADRTQ